MAYDEKLAGRIRSVLSGRCDFAEKEMFGGVAFMIEGHMGFGVVGGDLMVRVGPDGHEEALSRPHTRPMDFTGRPMKGMVYVAPAGLKTAKALEAWVARAMTFIASLPARAPKKRPAPRARPERRRGR